MGLNAGIDIGSVTTKCVIVKENAIIAKALTKTGVDTQKSAEFVFAEALRSGNINASEVVHIGSTGYGRRLFKKANKIITEIGSAGYGAYILVGRKKGLIIDVGGQDTKIIEIDDKGEVTDFLMNDKCAAGTGRFLEMMAGVLETDIDGLSKLAMKSNAPVTINSTCSVFAESEVISLISKAAKKENIAAGLFNAISDRISVMLKQFGGYDYTLFCGGGAKSQALKNALEKTSGLKIVIVNNPQFVAAFGAAIF